MTPSIRALLEKKADRDSQVYANKFVAKIRKELTSWQQEKADDFKSGAASTHEMLVKAIEALEKIKSGAGRAEVLGLEMLRCPQCASAEISKETLEAIYKELGEIG